MRCPPTSTRQHCCTLLILFAAVALAATNLAAQAVAPAPAAKLPAYDVVSIKPNKSGGGQVRVRTSDSSFQATNVSLKNLLLSAYNLKEAQLVNLPPWVDTARFDINAKVLEPDPAIFNDVTELHRGPMLQAMLADRFKLRSHIATAILPMYELTVAKGGPKLKASQKGGTSVNVHNSELTANGVPLATLADELSSQLQRIVIDRTGLTGSYDLTLKWSRDDAPPSDSGNAPPVLLTALQEQLGLKLVAAKAPVPTFVIDHVELPSEN